jgi:hypothetical protein
VDVARWLLMLGIASAVLSGWTAVGTSKSHKVVVTFSNKSVWNLYSFDFLKMPIL